MSSESTELVRVLKAEAEKLQSRRAELEEEGARIAAELEHLGKRQELVIALLNNSGCPTGKGKDAIMALMEECSRQGAGSAAGQERGDGARRDVAALAYEILLARGKKPMYYEDLAAEVTKAGGHLGGTTPAQTLVARISRDPRFVRPEKRGWYAARDFYPKAKSVGARKPGRPVRTKRSTEQARADRGTNSRGTQVPA
jgi:hypothetical protein